MEKGKIEKTITRPEIIRKIVVLLYDGFTILDAIGPTQCLSQLKNVKLVTVAKHKGPISSDDGLQLQAEYSINEIDNAWILIIPGGLAGTLTTSKDDDILDWIRRIDKTTEYTTSVCTGAWILSSAGLLAGRKVSTHWYGKERLKEYGAVYTESRYSFDGKYVTSAGVSAGIDMALALVAKIAGDEYAKAVQLGLQYDPKPPFNCGSPKTAGKKITDSLKMRYDNFLGDMK